MGNDRVYQDLRREAGLPPGFALPATWCLGYLADREESGPAHRMLAALLWLSGRALRRGVAARFHASLHDLRHVLAYHTYRSDAPVLSGIEAIESVVWVGADGRSHPVFEDLAVVREGRQRRLEWIYAEPFAATFRDPPRFAVLEMDHLRKLHSGLDNYLYRSARLVWRMRKPVLDLDLDVLRRAAFGSRPATDARVMERARRSAARVSAVSDWTVGIEVIGKSGRGTGGRVRLTVLAPGERDQ